MAVGRVIVAGAGIAGLGAAWHLAQRGLEVCVLEAARSPGGTSRSAVRQGFTLEPAGALVSSADRELIRWISELGLGADLLPLRPVIRTLVHRGRAEAVDARSLAGIARLPGVRLREAARLIRLPRLDARFGDRVDPLRPELAAPLDDRSLSDFGRLYFGDSVVDRWMAPMVALPSLADPREASRVLFLHEYRRGWNARLEMLRGPLGSFAERAAGLLPTRTGVEVTRVGPGSDGRVALRTQSEGQDGFEDADAVVIATPAADALRIAHETLSLAERDAFAKVRYTPALTLAVGLRRSFAPHPEYLQFPRSEGSPLEGVLLEPGVAGGRVPEGHGLALLRATGEWSAAHWDAPDDAVAKTLTEAFARVFPRIHGAALFEDVLRVERGAPRFDVGRYREIAAFERIQRDRRAEGRRVYFAGDYLMGAGWNAALCSGFRAAAAVEEDLGPPSP